MIRGRVPRPGSSNKGLDAVRHKAIAFHCGVRHQSNDVKSKNDDPYIKWLTMVKESTGSALKVQSK
jgi:hypothetical protein